VAEAVRELDRVSTVVTPLHARVGNALANGITQP
jgi:hypothetical protein